MYWKRNPPCYMLSDCSHLLKAMQQVLMHYTQPCFRPHSSSHFSGAGQPSLATVQRPTVHMREPNTAGSLLRPRHPASARKNDRECGRVVAQVVHLAVGVNERPQSRGVGCTACQLIVTARSGCEATQNLLAHRQRMIELFPSSPWACPPPAWG